MIDQILADIGTQLRAQLPWVTETLAIARQDTSGVVFLQRPEGYSGIDDNRPGRLYFRFRDGWDASYSQASLISGPDTKTTEHIRAVLMHTCSNEHEIARFLALGLMNARNNAAAFGRYSTNVLRRSTDLQEIVKQETKNTEGLGNDRLRLCMVDFDVTYRDAVLTGDPTCIPACNVCG